MIIMVKYNFFKCKINYKDKNILGLHDLMFVFVIYIIIYKIMSRMNYARLKKYIYIYNFPELYIFIF